MEFKRDNFFTDFKRFDAFCTLNYMTLRAQLNLETFSIDTNVYCCFLGNERNLRFSNECV